MAVKNRVAELLEANRGEYISGENIARELDVSRAAVWKAIQKLQSEGFMIEAVTNRGYKLMESTDVLTKEGVEALLDKSLDVRVEVFKSVDSTNLELKRRAHEAEGLVVAAMQQTAGMGRLGRKFESPMDTGIYFSILLKPKIDNTEVTLLTSIAAVAVCEAIEQFTDERPGIKWVNDVFLNGKKINGTLTQASFNVENLEPEYVIVGIGVNIYEPEGGFPEEIRNVAGPVFTERIGDIRNKLLAEIINRYFYYYRHFPEKKFVGEYKKRSIVIGKRISLVSPTRTLEATALDIDDKCRLLVRYDDGTEELVSTGEISVRL